MIDGNCEDPVELWAEIWRLRADLGGPDGFATWKDAAVAERQRASEAEAKHRELRVKLGDLIGLEAYRVIR